MCLSGRGPGLAATLRQVRGALKGSIDVLFAQDVQLRGPNPPSAKLPVAWDVTKAWQEVDLHVVWAIWGLNSYEELVIKLRTGGRESSEEVFERASNLVADVVGLRSTRGVGAALCAGL